MRALVVGGGGREHALVWRLSQDCEVFATPGNAGIAAACPTFAVPATDAAGLEALARRIDPGVIVIGPEAPLFAGVADRLRRAGLPVLGPGADAARLEGSKAFAKARMAEAGVPTAPHASFSEPAEALDYARSRFDAGHQVAVKASGPALGKGVVICLSHEEAEEAIRRMMVEGDLGAAGRTVVIEDRLAGHEFSLLTLVSGRSFHSLPVAQDYKRALDRDRGPNTGGMGSCSPVPWLPGGMVEETERRVVAPILSSLAGHGMEFRGVLFAGLMLVGDVPYCLEYNVRFGDPETQTIVRRCGAGFAEALVEVALGRPAPAVRTLPEAAVTVVMAAQGYPGECAKGQPLDIGPMPDGVLAFHAGTAVSEGRLVAVGGRVLGVSAVGRDVEEARARAYDGVAAVRATGLRWRTDIAAA
jgi:phosphoribosylamine--glycine ligase